MLHYSARYALGLALCFTSSSVVSAQDKEVDKLKAIEIQLEQMTKQLKEDFKLVAEHIKSVKDELAASAKDAQLKLQDAQNRLGQLEKQMLQMRIDMDALQKRSTALYPPNGTGRTSFYPAPVGSIVVDNRYAQEILFVINGTGYRVAPYTMQQFENVPVGSVTYEIVSTWGVQRRTSTILANAPLRVNVQ